MNYKITFEDEPTYFHAKVTGSNSQNTVLRYMNDIYEECIKRDCFRVLIEEQLDGPRLDGMEIFSLVSEGSMKALGRFEAIAYVDENMGDMAEFAETISVNRGMPISVFDNVDDAKNWLTRQKPGASGQDIFLDRAPPDEKN